MNLLALVIHFPWYGWIAVVGAWGSATLTCGGYIMEKYVHDDAVENGVGEYYIDPTTHKTCFRWVKKPNDQNQKPE